MRARYGNYGKNDFVTLAQTSVAGKADRLSQLNIITSGADRVETIDAIESIESFRRLK